MYSYFCFFKQKTAYEMRISDWSSDVCSSDLLMGIIANDGMRLPTSRFERLRFAEGTPYETVMTRDVEVGERVLPAAVARAVRSALVDEIGRAPCRERVCQYV